MEDFDLISFPRLLTAKPVPRSIAERRLKRRRLVVRTGRGTIAKMDVETRGADLHILRLGLYSFDACLLRIASGLVLKSGHVLDLDTMRVGRNGGDLRWQRGEDASHVLEPVNGAAIAELADGGRAARPRPGEPLHFRTKDGRSARLLVDENGKGLRIRELVVLDPDGSVHLRRAGIELAPGTSLDLDSGRIGGAREFGIRYRARAGGSGGLDTGPGTDHAPPAVHQMVKYLKLLASEKIRSALVFEDAKGALPYDEWSEARKTQLREWLHMRETGQPFPISGPPPIDEEWTIRHCAAWKIYLAHVAQSFWADANDMVPWRLEQASPEHLEHLLDSRTLFSYREEGHNFALGWVTHWDPVFSWNFLVAEDLLRASHWGTIKRVAEWARAHLNHILSWQSQGDGGPFESQMDQWDYLFGYRGPPPVDKMIEPLPVHGKHITHGCSGTDGFFNAVLRTANIPVRLGITNFSGDFHSRAEFFTVGRNLAHGDDPYTANIKLGHNIVPIGRIFMTDEELEELIDSPEPLPNKNAASTATHNHRKFLVALAVEYKTNWLLRLRCKDIANNASGPGSELQQELNDFYTVPQMAQIIQDCDAELETIPGGCGAVWW